MSKDVWLNANKETAGDLILTGYNGLFHEMPVYDEVKSLFDRGSIALDFGCGVGRNSVALSKTYDRVIAFDLPSMISLVPEENKITNISYTTNWEYVKQFKFDLALASLVFQHIEDSELNFYLKDLFEITNRLVIHSRTWIDHSLSQVLPIVEQYFITDTIKYAKDPNNPVDDHFIAVLKNKKLIK
jgi:2-polyprenyl-3-methyl-5-hydroxy-6-metoxy-1,4-benzoquinol methylase